MTDKSLPAAVASPQPCASPETIIWWWNPMRMEEDHEVFESLDAALAELETWKVRFPWNTYHVATEVLTCSATAKWKDPFALVAVQGHNIIVSVEYGPAITISQGSPDGETPQAEGDE